MDDDVRDDRIDADRLEYDWRHALDTASAAVSASTSSKALRPADAAAAGDHIRAERSWLSRFSPTLHKLFPRSQPPTQPPGAS